MLLYVNILVTTNRSCILQTSKCFIVAVFPTVYLIFMFLNCEHVILSHFLRSLYIYIEFVLEYVNLRV